MGNGLLTGFLQLIDRTGNWKAELLGIRTGPANHVGRDALSPHEMRDLGMLDGRVSPSTVDRSAQSGAWRLVDSPPHSL